MVPWDSEYQMRKRRPIGVSLFVWSLLCAPGAVWAQATVPFVPGMVVTESTQIEPGTYEVQGSESPDDALIVVRGSGVTLDLTGVYLQGTDVEADPDLATGVAVRVDGGTDVTIRGAHIRGYRFGILARETRGLRILDSELSYNWKPRLFSQLTHESLIDWLSYHNNEEREWMRFGAAIYLENVRGGEIRGNRVVQGMNALLMTYTDGLRVQDNTFSYNSGLGIGLYHSIRNEIVRNLVDYNVRGYSEGFYQRGQDSAGILVYAQSSNNVIAYNSATHSGDGLFLWAGQHTMDTGEDGANDNLIFHNNFSFAPTNAVEVTFSRNRIIANYLGGSRYGVWGGYSWETVIRGNCFAGNQYGVAIEHGQKNVIEGNRFDGDSLVISLWSRESEPADWGYSRERDTYSREQRVSGNIFAANAELWRLERTTGNDIGANTVLVDVPAEECDPRELLGASFDVAAPALPGVPKEIPPSPRAHLPRSAMVVDDWGPYDGRSPKLWPVDTTWAGGSFQVLGPPGRWSVVAGSVGVGGSATPESGVTGDTITIVPGVSGAGDFGVELEYIGEEVVSPRGTVTPAGETVGFGLRRFNPIYPGGWDVAFRTWTDPAMDPDRDAAAFDALFSAEPLLTRHETRLDYQWYSPLVAGLPQERWAAEATAQVDLEAGEYSIRTISDDGIRVWVDGELVIDEFEPHGTLVHYSPISAGSHDIRVQYFQIGGWSELRVDVVRGAARSTGSAGPH
jgi:parallel beta-helix repeat protein